MIFILNTTLYVVGFAYVERYKYTPGSSFLLDLTSEYNSIMYIYFSLLLADFHCITNVWKRERSKKKHGEGSYPLEKKRFTGYYLQTFT